jgi:hypothetical protein
MVSEAESHTVAHAGIMTGPVSIDIVFDPETEAFVRAEWDALEARGLSSLAAYKDPNNRPHISLYSGTTDDAASALHGSAIAVPFAVRLGPPILFGSGPRRVLARSVVPTRALLDLRTAVHQQLAPIGAVAIEWMPHVTLARRMQLSSLQEALGLVGDDITGRATGLRSWNSDTRTVTALRTEPGVA